MSLGRPSQRHPGPGTYARLLVIVLAASLALAPAQDMVVAGAEQDYAPFERRDANGDPVGFNVDLLREIGREAGFEVRFELGAWPELVERIESGTVDVLGMFVSPSRATRVDFAEPHVIVSHRIFVPAGRTAVRSLEELSGRRVVVQRDAYSHEVLRDRGIDAELVLVANEREGLRRLVREGHDAALLTEHRARRLLEDEGLSGQVVSGPPVLAVEYAFAVPEGRDALLARLEAGLDRAKASGAFDRIYERWLTPLESANPPRPPWMRAAWVGAGTAGVLVLLVLLVRGRRDRHDRAEDRKAREELDFLRRHDPLTGLLNRRAFEGELGAAMSRTARNGGSGRHAVATVNIDHFRLVNETHGHTRADRALRTVADLIRRTSGPNDRAARLGSDEFAWLLVGADPSPPRARCERLVQRIRDHAFGDVSSRLALTASVGLATVEGDEDVVTILQRSDAAGLAAKEEGGDRVRAWRETGNRMAERRGTLLWGQELGEALQEERLELYLQAIVPADASVGSKGSAEVLVRLRSREGEVVPASRFMPAAERYGFASRIDTWVVGAVLAQLDAHPEDRHAFQRIHVNLSGRSLGDPGFLAAFEATLHASAVQLPLLCFEITETALIENLDLAHEVLTRLRTMGCRFALDDFGMGHASMRYLGRLPVDYLKIDGSFVRDMVRDPEAEKIVGEINRVAHTMGLRTIAEFVESPQIRELLHTMGVDEVQGFAIGRPAPWREVVRAMNLPSASR